MTGTDVPKKLSVKFNKIRANWDLEMVGGMSENMYLCHSVISNI